MPTTKQDLTGSTQKNLERILEDLLVKKLEPDLRRTIRSSLSGVFRSVAPDAAVVSRSVEKTPKAGGKCAAVWDELEKQFSREPNKIPALDDIMRVGKSHGWNSNNTRVEYYAWRRHKGIKGRVIH